MKKTKYVCPFLMHIACYLYKVKLWKTHQVYWKMPTDGRGGAYVVAQPRGKQGGYQVSCPFPKWMALTEMWVRRFGVHITAWVRHPHKMWNHQIWKYQIRKKQRAWEQKKRAEQSF